MTTKKKSLLGLSYLSVAVLGVSLLMAKPVSAEEEVSSQDASTVVTTQQGSDTKEQQISQETSQGTNPAAVVELIEVAENGEERILYRTQDPYHHGREDGYNAGYQDGQKPGAPEEPENYSPQPESNPYNHDQQNKKWYESGYSDNYYAGYRQGWDDNHYIWSTLKTVWYWVTSYFY